MGKNRTQSLGEELAPLLEKVTQEEVLARVMEKLDQALTALPEEAGRVLAAHWDGNTPEQIATQVGLPTHEVTALLERAKRDLRHQIRHQTKIKH